MPYAWEQSSRITMNVEEAGPRCLVDLEHKHCPSGGRRCRCQPKTAGILDAEAATEEARMAEVAVTASEVRQGEWRTNKRDAIYRGLDDRDARASASRSPTRLGRWGLCRGRAGDPQGPHWHHRAHRLFFHRHGP